jgi:hypothetical protein
MFINIITPCTRPANLPKIAASINIPTANYRWIIVRDANNDNPDNNDNTEIFFHTNPLSKFGNAQRNFALDLIDNKDSHVYFLDDDTTLHPELWESVRHFDMDFISFNQCHPNGTHRLGGRIEFGKVDSGNVLISRALIGDTRWVLNRYGADGIFIEECFKRATNPIYIAKTASIYNNLRI